MADSAPQKRRAITDLERRNIRRRRDTTGETQKELITWFAAQSSGRTLTQGQISTILSPTYTYLDTDPRKASQLGSKQHFKGDQLVLKDVLFYWCSGDEPFGGCPGGWSGDLFFRYCSGVDRSCGYHVTPSGYICADFSLLSISSTILNQQ